VPLIDLDTGEVLERALVGTLDLIERDGEGRVVVVDLKTSARKYTSLQTDAALQLSVYSYATAMNGADQEDLRLRFDVLTKTKQPELCRYWTRGIARRACGYFRAPDIAVRSVRNA
jgi:RecB family exonuclease